MNGEGHLSVCAIYRDEAPYMHEWIEFHRLVGVERFFLYDNGSVDDHEALLAPYLKEGVVGLRPWPGYRRQMSAYEDCLKEHADESRWIAFIDLDEFLFSPTGRPVPELLQEYEQYPAVGVNWAFFGTSGHRTQPTGLVIENYLNRCEDDHKVHRMVKSIVDPTQVESTGDPHYFHYRDGMLAVDELERPIPRSQAESPSFSKLRVNHYWSKSEEEARRKLAKGSAFRDRPKGKETAQRNLRAKDPERNAVHDETILMYADALRKALRLSTGD
jgi:glycosyl transferase family 92